MSCAQCHKYRHDFYPREALGGGGRRLSNDSTNKDLIAKLGEKTELGKPVQVFLT